MLVIANGFNYTSIVLMSRQLRLPSGPTRYTSTSSDEYDKRACAFLGGIHLAAAVIWLN